MKKIAVVGDIMLDTYYKGDWQKIGEESISVISVSMTKNQLGAAATVANNIKNLGHDVHLFGYIGNDESGKLIKDMLKKRKIKHTLFYGLNRTIRKSRINLILRFDEQQIKPINSNKLFEEVKKFAPDILIVSDFSTGAISQNMFNKLKTLKTKLLIDPKEKIDYSGAFLITPNSPEAKAMTGKEGEKQIIKKLKRKYKNILLTKGKDGMSLYEDGKRVFNIPTQAKEVYDVTGAGDTALAVIAVCLAEGMTLKDACILSNKAAGKVVEHLGQYLITREEICI